jgi:hypothetical protein
MVPLLSVLVGLAGCAGIPPAAIPKAPTPADLIKAIPQGNNTTLVNVAPPSPVHQTLPQFLGIPNCVAATQVCCQQVLAQTAICFPALAGILPGGPGQLFPFDPNSPAGQSPAVQTANKIKAEEDAAQAKIAALRYLATIGCAGCYPGVEDAFIAALDDCTEAVRYEATLAIRKTACNCHKCEQCKGGCGCNKDSCCSEKIQKKLRELAYDTDDDGCPKESSERVRRNARLALRQCGPAAVKPEPVAEPTPATAPTPGEGPKALPAAPGAEVAPPPTPVQSGQPVLPPPAQNGQPVLPPPAQNGQPVLPPPAQNGQPVLPPPAQPSPPLK